MTVESVTFTTPTARGASPIAKARLRNLLTGQLLNESIRVSEKFEEVELETHPAAFLYSDGERWHFMDEATYEQFDFGKSELGESSGYIVEGIEGMRAMLIDGRHVSLVLPTTVDLKVIECDPTIKGATAQAQMKPALLETGLQILVPPYLSPGEVVRVDTREARFIERAK
jgi:elongation factor P